MIDSHCHLDAYEFDADRAAVLCESRRRGVDAIVIPAVSPSNWVLVKAIASADESAWPERRYALGVHPLYIDRCDDGAIAALRAAAEAARDDPQLAAIGEIGLDYFVPGQNLERQLALFVAQLRIARDLDLPVILHVRRAIDPIARELRRHGPLRGIAHAFNGSWQQAERLIGLGMALGFGGAATFTRARNIRRLATALPLEALVLETDAPDIAPAWVGDGRNAPTELPAIAAAIAALRGITVAALEQATDANVRRVLRWN